MPIINPEFNESHTWVPPAMLGWTPQAVGEDAKLLSDEEDANLAHVAHTVDASAELFASLMGNKICEAIVSQGFFETQLQLLEKLYEVSSSEDLKRFLKVNCELIFVLFAVHQGLRQFFPGKFSLRILEAGDDALLPQLVLSVSTHLSPRDARKTLQDFRGHWWRKHYLPCFKDLTISLGFR